MKSATFEQKNKYFESTKLQAYIDSARLEGMTIAYPKITPKASIAELKKAAIARYTVK